MIEIQCTSCNTRYRIDERILPEDTPTFKCSRCGHVFLSEALQARPNKPAPLEAVPTQTHTTHAESGTIPHVNGKSAPVMPPPVEQVAAPESPPPPPPAPEPEIEEEPPADDPLNRTFSESDVKADTGEKLRFDFSDEGKHVDDNPTAKQEITAKERRYDGWQVGDNSPHFNATPQRTTVAPPSPIAAAHAPIPQKPTQPPLNFSQSIPAPHAGRNIYDAPPTPQPRPIPRFEPPAQPARKPAEIERKRVIVEPADIESPGPTHSSGFFIGAFFAIAVIFVGASLTICSEPAASMRVISQMPGMSGYFARPIVPATLVAIRDVQSSYRTMKGGHTALVITGTAENLGERPLHLVKVGIDLLDTVGVTLAQKGVYGGNELSARMLAEMTPREIELSGELSPREKFSIDSGGTAPFLAVFVNPPRRISSMRVSVTKAEAARFVSSPAPHA
ncbi:MAG TPA: DUF3426 domain-containing protein [Candidatus Binataceae bacterium]|nr:DUF3426 domain-containing protein [Candidatus Binataceae bacterium]